MFPSRLLAASRRRAILNLTAYHYDSIRASGINTPYVAPAFGSHPIFDPIFWSAFVLELSLHTNYGRRFSFGRTMAGRLPPVVRWLPALAACLAGWLFGSLSDWLLLALAGWLVVWLAE